MIHIERLQIVLCVCVQYTLILVLGSPHCSSQVYAPQDELYPAKH
jgi:hypothetical protein